jgi:hypothetical protein
MARHRQNNSILAGHHFAGPALLQFDVEPYLELLSFQDALLRLVQPMNRFKINHLAKSG